MSIAANGNALAGSNVPTRPSANRMTVRVAASAVARLKTASTAGSVPFCNCGGGCAGTSDARRAPGRCARGAPPRNCVANQSDGHADDASMIATVRLRVSAIRRFLSLGRKREKRRHLEWCGSALHSTIVEPRVTADRTDRAGLARPPAHLRSDNRSESAISVLTIPTDDRACITCAMPRKKRGPRVRA